MSRGSCIFGFRSTPPTDRRQTMDVSAPKAHAVPVRPRYKRSFSIRFASGIDRHDGFRPSSPGECARAIRGLMKNEFIYEPYWDCVRAKSRFDAGKFAEENGGVERAITPGSLDPRQALPRIFRRLYTLRNQIVHGGVTVRNGWGRKQLRDGSRIMEKVIPAVLNIMKRDIANEPSSERWGHLRYPRHNSSHRRPE